MQTSQIIPIPLFLNMLTPSATIKAIYCHANLPACYPPAPRGFRVLGCENGIVDLENLTTGTNALVKRSEIFSIRVFVTWEK